MRLSLLETQSITLSDCRSTQRTCSSIWEFRQKECPSAGVAVYEWLVRGWCCPLRQSNAQWQQVGTTKGHSSLTIQGLFSLSKSQKTRTADKETSTGQWRELSSGKADSVCQTNVRHTWARKCIKPTHCGLRYLYQLFWFPLKSSTYARGTANCYLILGSRAGRECGMNRTHSPSVALRRGPLLTPCDEQSEDFREIFSEDVWAVMAVPGIPPKSLQICTAYFIALAWSLEFMPHILTSLHLDILAPQS